MSDWGTGRYERTAAALEPVAEHVVSVAAPRSGECVLDLACGSGNAALLAARAGARVTGLDAAARLIEVARARAAAEALEADFVVGDVQELPFDRGAFDAVLSVFGVIFAADADRAFAELVRALVPGGRAVLAVWVPAGPIHAMMGIRGRALAAATGSTPPRFPWHDREAIGALADRHGVDVALRDGEISFVAASPEAFFAAGERDHPLSVASRPVLERAGSYGAVREQTLAALHEGNEDPQAFRVTSPYRLVELHRRG